MFAIISQIPFMLFHSIISDQFYLNIFFTLLLGLLSIYIYDKCKYKILGIFLAFIFASIAQITKCDYGFFGVSIILIFYIFKNNIIKADIFFIIATLLKYIIPCIKYNVFPHEYLYLFLGTSFSAIFLTLYNGKKAKYKIFAIYVLSYSFNFIIWDLFNFEINYKRFKKTSNSTSACSKMLFNVPFKGGSTGYFELILPPPV